VTVTVEGLEGTPQLWFGNAELDVTLVAADQLLVSSPYLGFESPVDVRFASDLGEDTWIEGFTYTDGTAPDPPDTGQDPVDSGDTQDTDTDTDTDTDSPGTGKTAGIVEMSLLQIACPSCFGFASDIEVFASAGFHTPVNASWTDWMPAVGTCVPNLVPSGPSVSFEDVGEYVYLNSGSRSVSLRKTNGSSGATYQSSGMSAQDYVRTASFDLSVPSDSGKEVSGVLATPQGWDSIQPFELLYTNPVTAFSAQMYRQSATFSWSPSGGSGTFMIVVQFFQYYDYYLGLGSYLGSVMCRGNDNGTFTIPQSQFQSYPSGTALVVSMYRYQIENSTMSGSGHSIEGVASLGVMGTGVLQ